MPPTDDNPLDWVIVGGESGPNARPCRIDWVRSIRDQCAAAGVAFFFKQWGSMPIFRVCDAVRMEDRKGADPAEWPEDVRLQQYPDT